MKRFRRRSRGFTLLELMTAVGVAVVLMAVASPFLGNATISGQLSANATNLLASVNLARAEATKRNSYVTICVSTDGATCASSGTWEQGWIVFVDPNKNAAVDTGESVVTYQAAAPSGYKMTETLNSATNIKVPPFGIMTQYTFCVYRQTPSYGAQERKVTISTTGQARITKTTNANGTCS